VGTSTIPATASYARFFAFFLYFYFDKLMKRDSTTTSRTQCLTMDFIEIFLWLLGIGLDGFASLVPVGWANLTVLDVLCQSPYTGLTVEVSSYLLGELESVDKAKGFIDGPSDGEIIDSDLAIIHISHWKKDIWSSNVHTCLIVPLGSIMNKPLRATPSSSIKTP